MAKFYKEGNVTLKIDNMNKRVQHFIDNNDNRIATLFIFRQYNSLHISFDSDNSNEESIKDIMKCYNKFIESNKKIQAFLLSINKNGSEFDIHGIKKDLNSPITLVTGEQLKKLDENNVDYYKYHTEEMDAVNSGYGDNEKIICEGNCRIDIDSPDKLKNCSFTVQETPDNKIGNVNLRLKIDGEKQNSKEPITIPNINVFGHNKDEELSLTVDSNLISLQVLDFSNVKEKFDIIRIEPSLSKEDLLKTLETVNGNPRIILNRRNIASLRLPANDVEYMEQRDDVFNENTCFRKNDLIESLKKIVHNTKDNLNREID